MPTLLLVDGSSYLYRAFHALPDMRNARGEPTGAVYGVLNMLRRLLGDYKAERLACVFDAKGKTFRDDLYPAYKANRPPMPEDLRAQIEPIHACVQAMGWPLVMVEGVEADDVIGTLARRGEAAGYDVVISTGDKDMAQLVTSRVRLVNTMSNEVLDEAGVLAKFGVPPTRIVDYLALVGDTVDNVPGVEKCGPKTAVKWLTEFDSLDGVVAAAQLKEIKGKKEDWKIGGVVGDKLRAHLDFLPVGRKLVTIETDCELPVTLDQLDPATLNRETLAEWFERLEFRTWLRETRAALAGGGSEAAPAAPAEKAQETTPAQASLLGEAGAHRAGYVTILDWPTFDAWLVKITAAQLTAFDTETDSLDPLLARLVGMSFCVTEGEAAYLPLTHRYPDSPAQLPLDEVLDKLRGWFESDTHKKLGQNLKYDMHVLANHGIRLRGVAHDTLLESFVVESDKGHDLDQLAKRHAGMLDALSYTDVCGKGANQIGFHEVDIQRATEYAAEDADATLRVHNVLIRRVEGDPALAKLYRDIEMPALEVLWAMERNGVLIDRDLLIKQSDTLGRRMMEIEAQAHALAKQPFNLNSPKQIQEILFEREQLPVIKKTPGGQPSTDEEVLQQLALDYPLPKLLLEYRSMAKLKSTYTDKLPRSVNPGTGRVHTSFSQAGAVTGRLSSSEPNLQNIPVRTEEGRRIRAAFIAAPGNVIVSADYSQIELRIMAHLSDDARLLEAFAQGEDVHRATAAEVFGLEPAEVTSEQRRYAKAINFGLIYGMSAHGLAKALDLERSAAQAYIDRYFARYPGVARYMEETRHFARDHGYVETVFGRRLMLPEIRAAQVGRRQGAERAAINAPMQGTAADIVKIAMRKVYDWLQGSTLQSKLLLQVHDELVLEVPQGELEIVKPKLAELMSGAAALKVPLLVEVGAGANWDEAH
ncbi:DNA polymerase I [Niveibacterium sp. 24ML]|uniref:DNA polymerase I n=1 Tax=Niveibacterium sp. 24ML TaxID=2985512 RepID=UPI00226F21EB|nr:DNA polymerase I [Niveibacterium sp. 24ML]MCX9154711.1 DNA polymerase I [Niveibacterium sp. 24ML]